MSIRHTNGDSLHSTTLPTLTGDWIQGAWIKCDNYTGSFEVFYVWENGSNFIGVQTETGGLTTSIYAFIYNGGALDAVEIASGSDTSWIFVAIQHAASATTYLVRWRRLGETTFQNATISAGGQITTPSDAFIGTDSFNENLIDGCTQGYFVQATTMDDATLLAASIAAAQGTSPAGTNLHSLLLVDTSEQTGGNWANAGSGGTWAVTGTLQNGATSPTETFSGPGTPTLSPADNATGVVRSPTFSLTFIENVAAVATKTINLYTTSGDTLVESISVTDGARVSVSSNVVTFTFATTLTYGTQYYILADSGSFESTVDSEIWDGISSTTAWSFTTREGNIIIDGVSAAVTGTSPLAPAFPGTVAAGDLLKIIVGQKPSSANGGTVTTPSGWTRTEENTGATDGNTGGYGTTLTGDQGNTNIYSFERVADGSEIGSQSVTLGSTNVAWAIMFRFSKETGTWSTAGAVGKITTGSTSPSVTFGTDPGVEADDYVIGAFCAASDSPTFSAQAFSQTGVTFGTATEHAEPKSSTGNDVGGMVCSARVSSGTSSAAPTMSATSGGTTTHNRGPALFLRVRAATGSEPPPPTLATRKSLLGVGI